MKHLYLVVITTTSTNEFKYPWSSRAIRDEDYTDIEAAIEHKTAVTIARPRSGDETTQWISSVMFNGSQIVSAYTKEDV